MIVVDASVLAPALSDDGADGDVARARLLGEKLMAPELIDLETVSVFRRNVREGKLTLERAKDACSDLLALPIERAVHQALIRRVWELRENVTPYDAAYVAVAEALSVPLVTADGRLSRAPSIHCDVEVLGTR